MPPHALLRPRSPRATRRVVLFGFPGMQSLDLTGPLEVFAAARAATGATGATGATATATGAHAYDIEVVGPQAGPMTTASGLTVVADRALRDVVGPVDTLLVVGGDGTAAVAADPAVVRAVERVARRSRRIASVCTGAFVLAEAGLLTGRRATTHWRSCRLLARRYPAVTVEDDAIFVRDGDVWTSAGVTAGIDLTLAMVEEDLGRDTALAVARRLVVFLKRPGGQSQFSAQLAGQFASDEPLRELQAWIVDNPGAALGVEQLSARVAMSPRNFSRVFRRETGTTPARYVEQVRVEAARRLLEDSAVPADEIARRCGFGTAETMRRAFLRTVRTPPRDYRNRFQPRKETA